MEEPELERAIAAAKAVAAASGLRASDATVVRNSDRAAIRLGPDDVLARVAPPAHHEGAAFEVEVARRLAETDSPVAELDPRVEPMVQVSGGFAVSLWTYYEHRPSSEISPTEYARALAHFHSGLREIDLEAPHFTERVAGALRLVADLDQTPELSDPDRDLLGTALERFGGAVSSSGALEQLLHGEPHPENLLNTTRGPLFIDLGTCVRGPIEFDIAHGLLPTEGHEIGATELCAQYPGANPELIDQSYVLIWAMITMWRWNRDDQMPDRLFWAAEGVRRVRSVLDLMA